MRGLIFIFLLLAAAGCASKGESADQDEVILRITMDSGYDEEKMLQDRQDYIDYRALDFDELSPENVAIWETEWFIGLSDQHKVYLVDSVGGFDHLRKYLTDTSVWN